MYSNGTHISRNKEVKVTYYVLICFDKYFNLHNNHIILSVFVKECKLRNKYIIMNHISLSTIHH